MLRLIQHMTGCLRKPDCIPLAHEKLAIVTIPIFRMARETIIHIEQPIRMGGGCV